MRSPCSCLPLLLNSLSARCAGTDQDTESAMLNHLLIQTSAKSRCSFAPCVLLATVARALIVFSLFSVAASVWAQPPVVLEAAPDFSLKSSTGHNLRLSEFRGDVVIVNFWSTNCGQCDEQLGQLNLINTANQSNRVSILSVNVDRDNRAATRMIAAQNFSFPVLFDADKAVVRLYDPSRLPMTVVVDPHGTIRYIHAGFKRDDEALYSLELAKLLAE